MVKITIKMKRLVFIISFIFITTVVYAAPPAPWEVDELIGKPSPDFKLRSTDQSELSLSSFRGKVILLNFWATWCLPCKYEMPSLNKLYNLLKDKGFTVIAISKGESEEKIWKFLKKIPLDFWVVSDPDMKVSNAYKIFSLPITFLIDKDQKIVKRYLGEKDWTDKKIIDEIKGLLNSTSGRK